MLESELKNSKITEQIPDFSEVKEGDTTKFICKLNGKEIGFISASLVNKDTYTVGGLFVDPQNRGKGISSSLVKLVNEFLNKNNSIGKLVNTIKGDAMVVYEKNGWVKGEFKSQDAYGAYEYTYDGRKSL